ncbi:MAG: FliM/FliN family flagellar motor C-terminal domain-containing protein [Acidobacteriia bacterium]|nr:FliM/FliN family flagellar motor C-terminal domain-containing protein [Terriglobia bacterium]
MDAAVQPAKETPQTEPEKIHRDPVASYGWLPCRLSLEIAVTRFTVADLLRLTKGSIVETAHHNASDIPLRVNGVLLGWTEFEVIGNRLAVRITELAG